MKIAKMLTLAVSLFLTAGCGTGKSKVASVLGFEDSEVVVAGPYELHYAQDGSNEFVLVSKDNYNLLSDYGEGIDIFIKGRPFFQFELDEEGTPTKLFLYIPTKDGKDAVDLVDKDADGQWDFKHDHISGKRFDWKDGRWIERSRGQPDD